MQGRATTLTIAGVPFTVTQAAAASPACAPTVTPTSLSVPAAGANGTLAVTAAAGCAWTADSSAGWIRLFVSGIATPRVGYRVDVNPSGLARTATLTIAGQAISVTQSAATSLKVTSAVPSGQPAGPAPSATLPSAARPVLPTAQPRTLSSAIVSR